MGDRLDLQTLLTSLLESSNVYFQPPPSLLMQYPCIVYERSTTNTEFADNRPYKHTKRYQVTVIDRNPDSDIPDRISNMPMCSHSRFFTANGLNHNVYDLFF